MIRKFYDSGYRDIGGGIKLEIGDRVLVKQAQVDTQAIGKVLKVKYIEGRQVYLEGCRSSWSDGTGLVRVEPISIKFKIPKIEVQQV